MVLQFEGIELSYGRFIQDGLSFVEPFRMDGVNCPLGVGEGCWLEAGCLASFGGGFVWLSQEGQAARQVEASTDVSGKGLHRLQEDGISLLPLSGDPSIVHVLRS